MPHVERPGGIRIHFEQHGSGPLVVLGSWWSMHPSALEPITAELAADHRVLRYDDRGSGSSTRAGPYDLETAAGDLAAVIDAVGGPAVVASVADGPNRALRVLGARPDLVAAVVALGAAPVGRRSFARSETLATSDSVVGALMQQVDTDYRGALRSLLASTNTQMSEPELRERVARQAVYSPQESAAPRLRAWAEDSAVDLARDAGRRLWVLVSDQLSGGWFPPGAEMARYTRELLPEAQVVEVANGWVSRPDETAAVVRRITARATTTSAPRS